MDHMPTPAELDALIDQTAIDWAAPDPAATLFRFAAPSGELAAWSLGDPGNPRVLLVPGATGSKEDFWLMAPALVSAGYFVQSYDLAGQYESAAAGPSPSSGRWDYPLFVDDMLAFIEDAGTKPVHLLGYSFAGVVAQMITADHPELVSSLTLLTSPPMTGQVFRGVRFIGLPSRIVSYKVCASLMLWGIRKNVNGVTPNRGKFVLDRLKVTNRTSVDDIIDLMRHTPDLTAQLRQSGIPILVATGDGDLYPVATYRKYAEQLGARLAVYRTGHSPCEITPNQLTADMLALFGTANI